MLKDYIWQLVLTGVVSYLIGCVNAAILLSKKFKKTDIRTVGSKNPGTTNMYRVFGFKMGQTSRSSSKNGLSKPVRKFLHKFARNACFYGRFVLSY